MEGMEEGVVEEAIFLIVFFDFTSIVGLDRNPLINRVSLRILLELRSGGRLLERCCTDL